MCLYFSSCTLPYNLSQEATTFVASRNAWLGQSRPRARKGRAPAAGRQRSQGQGHGAARGAGLRTTRRSGDSGERPGRGAPGGAPGPEAWAPGRGCCPPAPRSAPLGKPARARVGWGRGPSARIPSLRLRVGGPRSLAPRSSRPTPPRARGWGRGRGSSPQHAGGPSAEAAGGGPGPRFGEGGLGAGHRRSPAAARALAPLPRPGRPGRPASPRRYAPRCPRVPHGLAAAAGSPRRPGRKPRPWAGRGRPRGTPSSRGSALAPGRQVRGRVCSRRPRPSCRVVAGARKLSRAHRRREGGVCHRAQKRRLRVSHPARGAPVGWLSAASESQRFSTRNPAHSLQPVRSPVHPAWASRRARRGPGRWWAAGLLASLPSPVPSYRNRGRPSMSAAGLAGRGALRGLVLILFPDVSSPDAGHSGSRRPRPPTSW